MPLGLHINLTEGPPTSPPHTVPSLLTPDGSMLGKTGLRDSLRQGKVSMLHVLLEVKAQLSWFTKYVGYVPVHADGHQHVHVLPGPSAVIASCLGEMGVKWSRFSCERLTETDCEWVQQTRLDFYSDVCHQTRAARKLYADMGICMVDGFVGLTVMGGDLTLERLRSCFEKLVSSGCRWIEFMVHPGYRGKGWDDFNESTDREHELSILQSDAVAKMMIELKLSKVTWGELPHDAMLRHERHKNEVTVGVEHVDEQRSTASVVGKDKISLALVASLLPATGNLTTARRLASALELTGRYTVDLFPEANFSTADEFQAVLAHKKIERDKCQGG